MSSSVMIPTQVTALSWPYSVWTGRGVMWTPELLLIPRWLTSHTTHVVSLEPVTRKDPHWSRATHVTRSVNIHINIHCITHKGKVKVTLVQALRLCTGRTAHRGSTGIALPFLDHGTRRGWGVSVTPQLLFTPWGKTRYPFYRRLGGPQGRSGQVRKISPPPGPKPQTVQPIASHYTDWAIPAHCITWASKISIRGQGPLCEYLCYMTSKMSLTAGQTD